MSDESKHMRLPPPAFPPGSRKHIRVNSEGPPESASRPDEPGGAAFISPDEPIPPRRDAVAAAFISPDDPLPQRGPDSVSDAFISPDEPLPGRRDGRDDDEEEGVVTGMGDDPHLDPAELVSGGDPHVIEITGAVGRLAEALRHKGEAGLKATPGMSRFEATLRGYCVGYLAGRRAEDEADRREYAPFPGVEAEG